MKYILGLAFNYHDSSACLISDRGDLIACVDEERFSRIKHDNSFPSNSINYLFENYSLTNDDIVKFAIMKIPPKKR